MSLLLCPVSKLEPAARVLGLNIAPGPNYKADLVSALMAHGINTVFDLDAIAGKPAAPLVVPAAPVVDDSVIRAEISKAVAALIKPLETAITAKPEVARAAAPAVESKTVREVFGIDLYNAGGNLLRVDLYGDPEAPKIDPNYVWQENVLHHLIVAQKAGLNGWLTGDRSTGKTSAVTQFAAATGRKLFRVNFHRGTDASELFGCWGLDAGNSVWQETAFTTGFKHPGAIILLDEPTNGRPELIAQLNAWLEPGCSVTSGPNVYSRAPGVMVVACDNTVGQSDSTGRFVGTTAQNAALIDRYAFMETVTWLDPVSEARVICGNTGCPKPLADAVVKIWNIARVDTGKGLLVDAPTLRNAFAFVEVLTAGLPLRSAWRSTVVNKQPPESAAQLQTIFDQYVAPVDWGHLLFSQVKP